MFQRIFVWSAALLLPMGGWAAAPVVAQQPAAEAKADKADEPIVVPDGSPAELLEFIDKIKKVPPPSNQMPALVAHVRKVCTAVVAAVDKIGTAGDEQQQTRAITAKLDALHLLRRVRDPAAGPAMRKYLDELLADKRSFVPPLARVYDLATRLGEADLGDNAALEKLLEEVREHVRSAKPTVRNFNIALQTAMLMERAGLTKLATEAYVEFAAAFELSDDPKVVENAKTLAGAARFLLLPGHAMDVKGKTLGGEKFDVKQYAGKVVLVEFWATWCGPCVAELPNLLEIYSKYHDRGFEVVGISLDSERERLESFVKREEVPWTVLFDDDAEAKGWQTALAREYGVMSIPRAVLIGRDGKVVSLAAHGEPLWDLLAAQIGPPEVKKPDADAADDKAKTEKPNAGEPKNEKPQEGDGEAKPAEKKNDGAATPRPE